MIVTLLEFIGGFDQYLSFFIQNYGFWAYLLLFLVIFAETGFVVTPFLPGDSLLFAVGALSAAGSLDLVFALLLLSAAGILGDSANYGAGKYVGDILLNRLTGRFIKREYIDKTHRFYEKYGGKTIIIARFVPIVRTFAPFVAGIGKMAYAKFLLYNVAGALLWVCSLVLAGYFFGNIPVIKNNFEAVVAGIILVSILPGGVELLRHRFRKKTKTREYVADVCDSLE